jgi:hypothetical protein
VYYFFDDAGRAVYTLNSGSTFLDWSSAFATTIDESGWFVLLIMLEIETYVIDDENLTGWVKTALHGARLLAFALIAHTVYAFVIIVSTLAPTVAVENASSLCDLTNDDVFYVYNLEYTEINEQTCVELSNETQFYRVGEDPVVSDIHGLTLERDLAWVDLAEVLAWLLIIVSIEIVVRLQGRGVTASAVISSANTVKLVLYASLIAMGVYWASLGHWVYFWDELVWIGGFAAIELNLSEWRDEIAGKKNIEQT